VSEGRDVLEAAVGEWGAVVALGRGDPAKDAAQPMVVVVLDKASQSIFGLGEAGKPLSVQDLGLQDRPERSILPLVQGELIWVRRCWMWRSRSRLPKRVST